MRENPLKLTSRYLCPGDSTCRWYLPSISPVGVLRLSCAAVEKDAAGDVFAVCRRQVFRPRTPPEAVQLVSRLMEFTPSTRLRPMEACAHCFFNELRDSATRLPSGNKLPPLFNFTPAGEGALCVVERRRRGTADVEPGGLVGGEERSCCPHPCLSAMYVGPSPIEGTVLVMGPGSRLTWRRGFSDRDSGVWSVGRRDLVVLILVCTLVHPLLPEECR